MNSFSSRLRRVLKIFLVTPAAVNRKKLLSLQKAAAAYRKEKKTDLDYRFDILAVLPNSIEHYENITWGMVK